ncbi:MAG: hypothetical protein VXY16_00790, partial [Pseudomonadota bacterium]|nr:hypothetical protein [Pseudomonadota bacterium]
EVRTQVLQKGSALHPCFYCRIGPEGILEAIRGYRAARDRKFRAVSFLHLLKSSKIWPIFHTNGDVFVFATLLA